MVWAFLLSLSFYPSQFGFLAWFSLARPLMIISRLKGREAFTASYFFGFFYTLFWIYWVALVTPMGMTMTVLIVAFYFTAILYTFNRLYHLNRLLGMIAIPFLWVGLEYFRTLSEFAFPWADLGYSQAFYLYMLQIVSVVSVHGLSLFIVAVNVLLWQVLRKEISPERRVTAFLSSLAVVALILSYGWVVMPPYPVKGDFGVAMLQGSVPIEEKWRDGNEDYSLELYDSLAQSVADSTINLIVWPETSAPCYISHEIGCRQKIGDIARKSQTYHLVGALGAFTKLGAEPRHYNSCYQFNPNGRLEQRYDKVKLVPFSEQAPYQDHLPFLKGSFISKYLSFIQTYDIQWWSDFYPGSDSLQNFDLPETTYGVLICFESAFPEYARQEILKGASFLVGITNDTWFGRSVGIHMHSRIFITRAVENRSWAVRAANSGLTYIVDKYGRIRDQLPIYETATLSGKIRLLDSFSFFTRFGDIAGRLSLLITSSLIGILLLAWLLRKILPAR